ncbi:hypothetical protein Tco_0230989 [Tanacetum coccineum]
MIVGSCRKQAKNGVQLQSRANRMDCRLGLEVMDGNSSWAVDQEWGTIGVVMGSLLGLGGVGLGVALDGRNFGRLDEFNGCGVLHLAQYWKRGDVGGGRESRCGRRRGGGERRWGLIYVVLVDFEYLCQGCGCWGERRGVGEGWGVKTGIGGLVVRGGRVEEGDMGRKFALRAEGVKGYGGVKGKAGRGGSEVSNVGKGEWGGDGR